MTNTKITRVEADINGKPIVFETGLLALQARAP
jgi:hypothetical protein